MAKAAINVKSSASKVAPKTIKKAPKSIKKLWERKKLAVGQYLSELAYYQVKKIAGKTVEVESSVGGEISVDFDLIKEMDSAQHHAKEVASTMTQLVEVLETAKDTVFIGTVINLTKTRVTLQTIKRRYFRYGGEDLNWGEMYPPATTTSVPSFHLFPIKD